MKTIIPDILLKILIGFFATTSFIACTKESTPSVLVRINNQSNVPISHVVVYSLIGENIFGEVGTNQITSYREVGEAYSLPACRFEAHGTVYRILIRCATPSINRLDPGRYSFYIRNIPGGPFEVVMEKD